jgi:hypothetical protein
MKLLGMIKLIDLLATKSWGALTGDNKMNCVEIYLPVRYDIDLWGKILTCEVMNWPRR